MKAASTLRTDREREGNDHRSAGARCVAARLECGLLGACLRGAAGVVINQQIHVGWNVTRADIPAILSAAREGTVSAIAEEKRRNPNGPFA